jgi:Ser-tRNA(Ala) deacylase AlaX
MVSDAATELIYWTDTYLFEDIGTVSSVFASDSSLTKDTTLQCVVLDRTIFHPQGGGQPYDTGEITSASGQTRFAVCEVRMRGKQVVHLGRFEGPAFSVGDEARLRINRDKRELYARLHSAGHLVDVAVESLQLTDLKAGKGYHFPDGPYVEYVGQLPASLSKDQFHKQLESELARLIDKGGAVSVQMVQPDQVESLCGSFPDYLPRTQPARVVTFPGLRGGPCGGTHVDSVSRLGRINVRKVDVKKGKNVKGVAHPDTVRVCYTLADA